MAKSKVIVVGAGPVGALAALYAAQRGDDVEVYELRPDLRLPSTTPLNFTRSINLAISERGINSIKLANRPGLIQTILDDSIPMHSRMIHGIHKGQLFEDSQPYDARGRSIRAVDRGSLNKRLLDELERMPNVKFFFSHKLTGADFKRNLAWFEQQAMFPDKAGRRLSQNEKRAAEVQRSFDFMIGADGAHSAVRFHLMKYARVSFQQDYIDTLWCEFHIPPAEVINGKHGAYRISPNHLHIWPGKTSMFIAIASVDSAFTCTLFLPAAEFEALDQHPDSIVQFFEKKFPGVVPSLISPSALRQQYLDNKHLPLVSVKCSPYHYESSAVILGDAAHAMVPFYGQGMNAGLEDVRVLFDVLDSHSSKDDHNLTVSVRRANALSEYNNYRKPDAFAINDLALRNYEEMRLDVRSPLYLLRKRVEEFLSVHVPSLDVATQYSRISFGNGRYSDIEAATQWQSAVFHTTALAFALSSFGFVSWLIRRLYKIRQFPRLLRILRDRAGRRMP